jgi:iron-sulfur cluster repair protein YtfE (RIC family)
MLVSLRLQPTQLRSPEDPFSLLRDCHQRIRTFAAMASRLACAVDPPPGEVAEAASRVERYFTVGLPKHVADEDLSLAPRLRGEALSPEVLGALVTMESQHRSLEALLERLIPRWRALVEDPGCLASLVPDFAEDSRRLELELEAHLVLEETVLFPAAAEGLSAESVASLGREMRDRRGMAP